MAPIAEYAKLAGMLNHIQALNMTDLAAGRSSADTDQERPMAGPVRLVLGSCSVHCSQFYRLQNIASLAENYLSYMFTRLLYATMRDVARLVVPNGTPTGSFGAQ